MNWILAFGFIAVLASLWAVTFKVFYRFDELERRVLTANERLRFIVDPPKPLRPPAPTVPTVLPPPMMVSTELIGEIGARARADEKGRILARLSYCAVKCRAANEEERAEFLERLIASIRNGDY